MWVVDPIDGTDNYIAEIPVWATLVALIIDGDVVLGVAHAPALDETYEAARGMGAYLNSYPISVDEADLGHATVLDSGLEWLTAYGLARFYSELVGRARRARGFGDFWGHMLVARGAAHVMVEPELQIWDYAALQPIVEEAGGRITQLDGSALTDGGSCLTTNGVVHDEVLQLARETVAR